MLGAGPTGPWQMLTSRVRQRAGEAAEAEAEPGRSSLPAASFHPGR